jgi:hypothetical protein
MKRVKLMLSAFAILAIVGSALAFKAKTFTAPTVFCLATGTVSGVCPSGLVNYVVDVNGDVTNPCSGTLVPHVYNGTSCVNTPANTTFTFNN